MMALQGRPGSCLSFVDPTSGSLTTYTGVCTSLRMHTSLMEALVAERSEHRQSELVLPVFYSALLLS